MAQKKRVASTKDPAIEASAGGLFRFETAEQAAAMLARLRNQFIISKDQPPIENGPALKLWIRDFDITPKEKNEGYRGHFALITIKRSGGRFTLKAEKIPMELKQHPQKERPKFKHPNWGHPILRAVQRKKIYANTDDARSEMLRLHEEFPETTIPGIDKLHLMIYSRKSEPPIQRLTLFLQPAEGGCILNVRDQKMKALAHPEPIPAPKSEPKAEAKGKYTTLVKLQRGRKKK